MQPRPNPPCLCKNWQQGHILLQVHRPSQPREQQTRLERTWLVWNCWLVLRSQRPQCSVGNIFTRLLWTVPPRVHLRRICHENASNAIHFCKPNQHSCPEDNPTWCICKWATAAWIKGHGHCDDSIEIDCPASDVCATGLGLFFSYHDGGVNLTPAHECAKIKCADQWKQCCLANPGYDQDCGSGETVAVKGWKTRWDDKVSKCGDFCGAALNQTATRDQNDSVFFDNQTNAIKLISKFCRLIIMIIIDFIE